MVTINVLYNPNPVIDYTYGAAMHSCLHTTAAIVTTNNDMAYFESVHSVIENTEQVQISVHDHVRDVSVNKNFTWLGPNNDIGGYSTVRTPDPEDGRSLSFSLLEEELGVNVQFLFDPQQVVFQKIFVESLLKSL